MPEQTTPAAPAKTNSVDALEKARKAEVAKCKNGDEIAEVNGKFLPKIQEAKKAALKK